MACNRFLPEEVTRFDKFLGVRGQFLLTGTASLAGNHPGYTVPHRPVQMPRSLPGGPRTLRPLQQIPLRHGDGLPPAAGPLRGVPQGIRWRPDDDGVAPPGQRQRGGLALVRVCPPPHGSARAGAGGCCPRREVPGPVRRQPVQPTHARPAARDLLSIPRTVTLTPQGARLDPDAAGTAPRPEVLKAGRILHRAPGSKPAEHLAAR